MGLRDWLGVLGHGHVPGRGEDGHRLRVRDHQDAPSRSPRRHPERPRQRRPAEDRRDAGRYPAQVVPPQRRVSRPGAVDHPRRGLEGTAHGVGSSRSLSTDTLRTEEGRGRTDRALSFCGTFSRVNLRSMFPPMPTPFRDGEVDAAAVRANVRKWIAAGLGGVLTVGTNGEAALLDDDEADRVIAAARQEVPPDRVLLAGAGHESTRATIAAARRAAAAGADAVLVKTPSV